MLRLARKAGRLIVGVALTRAAVRDGRVHAAWMADDLSQRRAEALLDRWRAAGIRIYRGWSKDELGDLAGKAAVAVLSVTDPNITAGVSRVVAQTEVSEEERQGGEQS